MNPTTTPQDAEREAARINEFAGKYASTNDYGEVIFPGDRWHMFVADLSTARASVPPAEPVIASWCQYPNCTTGTQAGGVCNGPCCRAARPTKDSPEQVACPTCKGLGYTDAGDPETGATRLDYPCPNCAQPVAAPSSGEREETPPEFILKAMYRNYSPGHLWDRLDAKACQNAVEEIKRLRAALAAQSATAAPVDAPTAQLTIEALEAAKNGLEWHRDMSPELCSPADVEMDAQIDAAIAALATPAPAAQVVDNDTICDLVASALNDYEAEKIGLLGFYERITSTAVGAQVVPSEPCATCGGKGVVAYSVNDRDEYEACPECATPPAPAQGAGMTPNRIMAIASEWFVTGENQKYSDGYRYRSIGVPSNVTGIDLLAFARAILAAAAQREQEGRDE